MKIMYTKKELLTIFNQNNNIHTLTCRERGGRKASFIYRTFLKHQQLLICIYFFWFIRNGRWLVLIDAAKGSATMPPDLSKYPVDFVALSFYKVYGFMFNFSGSRITLRFDVLSCSFS